MKKGDLITGKIEKTVFPDKGILYFEGKECVVKNTVPGQIVEARVQKKRGGRIQAQLLKVTEKAPQEKEPLCPSFGRCGGCTYLNLPYEEQCALKLGQVRELLAGACPGAEEDPLTWFEGLLESPVRFGYRNKMEFTFGDERKDGPLCLGMHRRGSFYDIENADDCVLVDEDFRVLLKTVRDYFAKKKVPYFHRGTHEGYLRHLLIRKARGTGEILADLVTASHPDFDLAPLAGLLSELPLSGRLAGFLHTVNDSVSDTIKDEGTEVLYGKAWFEEELLGLRFKVTPFSFFQTNSAGAEVLYTAARHFLEDALDGKGTVYDLYCGTGTISQLVAPVSGKVIGVEIVEEAVEAARENAARNGIGNCEFLCGDVLRVLDEIDEKPDVIILDPPRDGVHPKALPKILSYGVEYILYISCKPTSLARDLPAFVQAGYRPVRGKCVDQFPWTANIETIVLFQREGTRKM